MNGLKDWWNQNTPRDQMALFFLGVAIAVYVLYAIVSASHGKYVQQLENNQRVMTSLSQVRDLSAQLAARSGDGAASGGAGSIVETVNNSLRTHNLRLNSMQPQSNGAVRLRLEQAQYAGVIAWLHEMEIVQGLKIKESTITTGSEKGLVSITVTLRDQ